MVYTSVMYRASRDALLQHILAVLSADERFVAAWLTGSLARGEEDDLSDLDLSVVVADPFSEQFCSCSPVAVTCNTSSERQALYERFGPPLVLREDRSWLGEGSCFNHVSYRETALVVDWVFISILYWTIQDVKKRIVGESWRYKRIDYPLVSAMQEQVALVRQFCDEMLALMPDVVRLGGSVPDDPMSVIEVWLSMVEDKTQKSR